MEESGVEDLLVDGGGDDLCKVDSLGEKFHLRLILAGLEKLDGDGADLVDDGVDVRAIVADLLDLVDLVSEFLPDLMRTIIVLIQDTPSDCVVGVDGVEHGDLVGGFTLDGLLQEGELLVDWEIRLGVDSTEELLLEEQEGSVGGSVVFGKGQLLQLHQTPWLSWLGIDWSQAKILER